MNHNRIGSCSKSFNTRASFWAHLDTPTKVRPKRAPVAELESSANPQPGKAALRSARFPACGFWRLSSLQMVVLSRCAHDGESADSLLVLRVVCGYHFACRRKVGRHGERDHLGRRFFLIISAAERRLASVFACGIWPSHGWDDRGGDMC